jgi:hypothetical protein
MVAGPAATTGAAAQARAMTKKPPAAKANRSRPRRDETAGSETAAWETVVSVMARSFDLQRPWRETLDIKGFGRITPALGDHTRNGHSGRVLA